jgi:hypothetical protein
VSSEAADLQALISRRVNNQCAKCGTTVEILDLPIGLFMQNPSLHDEDLAGWICGHCTNFICSNCIRATTNLTREDRCPLCEEVLMDKLPSYVPVCGQTSYQKLLNKPSIRKTICLYIINFFIFSFAAILLGFLIFVEIGPHTLVSLEESVDLILYIGPIWIVVIPEIVAICLFVSFAFSKVHPFYCKCLQCLLSGNLIDVKGLKIDEELAGIWLSTHEHYELYGLHEFTRFGNFTSVFYNPTTEQVMRFTSGKWGLIPGYLVWIYNGLEDADPIEETKKDLSDEGWKLRINGFRIRESDGSLAWFKRLSGQAEKFASINIYTVLSERQRETGSYLKHSLKEFV